MKRSQLIAVLVGIAAIVGLTSPAHARLYMMMHGSNVYPGVTTPVPPAAGGFGVPHVGVNVYPSVPTPMRHPDGPNLYQYVRSNPVKLVDPDGLWGRETHYGKSGLVDGTYEIAKRVGFSDKCAEVLAAWNQGVDDVTPAWAFPYFHFEPGRSATANCRWNTGVDKLKRANVYLSPWIWDVSVYDGLAHIGEALHGYQDAFAHKDTHHADTPLKHVTGPNAGYYSAELAARTRFHNEGDSLNYRPDDPDLWPEDHRATVTDTEARLNEIWKIPSVQCHCKKQ